MGECTFWTCEWKGKKQWAITLWVLFCHTTTPGTVFASSLAACQHCKLLWSMIYLVAILNSFGFIFPQLPLPCDCWRWSDLSLHDRRRIWEAATLCISRAGRLTGLLDNFVQWVWKQWQKTFYYIALDICSVLQWPGSVWYMGVVHGTWYVWGWGLTFVPGAIQLVISLHRSKQDLPVALLSNGPSTPVPMNSSETLNKFCPARWYGMMIISCCYNYNKSV